MSKSLPFLPLYAREYEDDTDELTAEQIGVYTRIILRMWIKGGALSADDQYLANVGKVTRAVWTRTIKPALTPFLTFHEDGTVTQKRLIQEMEKAHHICEKRSEVAREGRAKHKAKITGKLNIINESDSAIAEANVEQLHDTLNTVQREEAKASSGSAAQASLIPDDPKPAVTKPLSPYRAFQAEAIPILAKLLGKDPDSKAGMTFLAKTLNDLRSDAEGDDDLTLRMIRAAEAAGQDRPVGWIKAQIGMKLGKARKGDAPKPALVVDNDPLDRHGIQAWCRSHADTFVPAEGEALKLGKWRYGGWLIDNVARQVCEAAEIPGTWRGDLDPIIEWIDAGMRSPAITKAVETAMQRWRQADYDFQPPENVFRRIKGWVMSHQAAA